MMHGMKRRDFLRFLTTATCAGAASSGLRARAATPTASGRARPFLLSKNGCGRATGYAETNKIISLNRKTHVAWLDSVSADSAGFFVRIRTLDRTTSGWSPTYTIGEAFDNHGGPALAVKTAQYNIGVPIHYYARINFSAFEQMVDLIGGIDVYVEEEIVDPAYPDEGVGFDPLYIPAEMLQDKILRVILAYTGGVFLLCLFVITFDDELQSRRFPEIDTSRIVLITGLD